MKLTWLIITGLFIGCASKSTSFELREKTQVHQETGVELLREFPGWMEVPDSRQDKISPEILSSIFYQAVTPGVGWRPNATIYILREKSTSNLKVVENRVATTLERVKFLKTESLKLKSKKRIILSTYQHQIPWASTDGSGSKTLREIKAVSYFATPDKGSNTVIWVLVERESKAKREMALSLIENGLFGVAVDLKKPAKK